jgi:small subunit ribosomal protein S1
MRDEQAGFETPSVPQTDSPDAGFHSEPPSEQQVPPATTEPLRVTPSQDQPPASVPLATGVAEAPPRGSVSAQEPASEPAPGSAVRKAGMDDVFADEYEYQRPKRGEIREGRILAIRPDSIVVDLGLKREGLIPQDDMQRLGTEVLATLKVGDQIPVYVLRPEDDRDGILVSLHRARQEQDWIDAQRLHDAGEIWEGLINGYNRGGLIVHFGKIRGFVPASHVTGVSRRMDPTTLQTRLGEMVGRELPLKVIEVDRQNRRLIFSERTARREWRSQQRDKLMDELQEGDHVRGTVSNICEFGVFVDVGGTDGLVHISELSWRRTGHPSELLKIGDEVEAYVLRVDKERKRIGLSLRLMEPDPWEQVEQKYSIGQVVQAVVTKITTFGAFAALDDGIEGLVHISELSEVTPRDPEELIRVGMTVPLCVVKIDGKRRRMGLSLKHVPEEERIRWEEQRKAESAAQEEAAPSAELPPPDAGAVAQAEPRAEETPSEPGALATNDLTPVESPAEAPEESGAPASDGLTVIESPEEAA